VLLGSRVVSTLPGTDGAWLVPEAGVREAAAELNAIVVDTDDLVRVGPFRGRVRAGQNESSPGLRWRQRIDQEQTLARNAEVPDRAGHNNSGERVQHLAGIDWRRMLAVHPGHAAQDRTWWLPRAVVQVLDAAEHAETRWLRTARTCQGCGAVTDQSDRWRVPSQGTADGGGQVLCPDCRTTRLRPYQGELEGHLYAAASRKGSGQAIRWLCAVCRQAPASVLDHCHEHGYVRAPVCPSCNTRERPEFLYRTDVLVGSRYLDLFGTRVEDWLRHWHRCPGCRTRSTLPLAHLAALAAHLAAATLRPTHREPGRGRKPCGVLRASWTGSQNAPASCEITVAVDFCPTGEHRVLERVSYREAAGRFRAWLAVTAPVVAAAAGPGRHDGIPAQFRPVVADTSGEGLALF
jgi:hypothetical protein